MNSVFNYQTLNVSLSKATRTLFINLKDQRSITMETLFELESLLAWVAARVEIHSIFISNDGDYFSKGYNETILPKLTIEKLQKFTLKLQKINQAIMLLPQTIICDLKGGATNIACELATACDIRIANRSCTITFNHAKLGLIPCSGGIAQLANVVGHANAKNWLLSGSEIRLSKLESSGFIFESYTAQNRDEVISSLLQNITAQAPVQRIQTKLGVIETIREHVDSMLEFESKIAQASMITEDWRSDNIKQPMPAKSMGHAVKLSIVKDKDLGDDLPN